MTRHRTLIRLSAALAGVALVWACGGDSPTAPPTPEPARPATVTVTTAPAELTALGATVQLTAEVRDQNATVMTGATVTWSSGDTSVATVDASGLVTAVGNGTATITASARSASGSAVVTVALVENPDRAALVALYEATDGPNWVNNENWLTDAPLGEWYGVDTDASGRVVHLLLGGNDDNWPEVIPHGLSGQIPSELGKLSNLTELILDGNNLTGSIPPELGNLTNLRQLYLRDNALSGPIPPELGGLANLVWLHLGPNNLSGPIPPELGSLVSLWALDLNGNDLTGPIPPELGGLTNLFELSLDGNNLTGSIPPELGNLTNLGILSLWDAGLSGSIPPELGNLTNVWYLRLINNDLSGPIPPELGNLANLSLLRLDWNDLTGPIPPELGNLAKLTSLVLSNNRLTGPIPPELGSLTNLESLNLGTNRLTGPIPPELGSLTNLERLTLGFNRLTGPIPTELGNLSALTLLHLRGNNLRGELPALLLRLPRLESLFLGPAFCAPDDPGIRARLTEMVTDLYLCPDGVRLLPSALMREDGNGMSLALPDDLRTASAVTVSDPSVVDASVADGWLKLSPRRIGSAEVKVSQTAGGDSAVSHVDVREAVGTFGIDVLVDQPVPFGYEKAMVEAADWWSYILDGTEWPDREAGCPTWDPFGGKVKALADELLVATRIEELEGGITGYASGCFFPVVGGRAVPALDPGGGYVVMGEGPSQGLVRHEIGHLLGLVLWPSEATLLATSDCRFFTGPHAVKAFRDGGGDPDLPGVPIQTDCGSHWHEDIVDYEIMGPLGGWDANSISLGALVDAGYTVDLSKALPWPRGAGAAARTAGEALGRDVVLGEPRLFIERRPREPPR